MEFLKLGAEHFEGLEHLHAAYKEEIGEGSPTAYDLEKLRVAIADGCIDFYGCVCEGVLVACCSICRTFSTFNYQKSGVFEDLYIAPAFRRSGIARKLVEYAYKQSGVKSLTVGCADCDIGLYRAIGFETPLGHLLVMSR